MEISNELRNNFIKRLLLSRTRILCNRPFFGILLMHLNFALDADLDTASTDGDKIYFGVNFLNELNDKELDFILMHELMHIVLKHCFRGETFDHFLFNIACDIVVNSHIAHENNDDLDVITLRKYGESMHRAPNGKEGYLYTAEEVYQMLINKAKKSGKKGKKGQTSKDDHQNNNDTGDNNLDDNLNTIDDHSKWSKNETDGVSLEEIWEKRVLDAAEVMEERDKITGKGDTPLFAKRMLDELKNPTLDWRTILTNFIQEEIVDYSFTPPDKRYDNGFFLPDFNDKDITVSKILFMIDSSGSMSKEMITDAFSEVKGTIDQFNGKLEGWLGFFDAGVTEPKPFNDVESLKEIQPYGGGGTSFSQVFDYIAKNMMADPPVSIIILTDGYDYFPKEQKAMGIPVLWVINNKDVTPPWGMVARILEEK